MELKELVETNNKWSRRAVVSIVMLGVCFLTVGSLHYMKVNPSSQLDFDIFMLFMALSVITLLCLLLYSLFMIHETTKVIIMSQRVLSQVVQNSKLQFIKLSMLDTEGVPVLKVLESHERYDLIERYGEELERIRQRLYTKMLDLMNDQGARKHYQALYERIAELSTWKLKDRSQADSIPSELNKAVGTMFQRDVHQNNSLLH